jgi:hypothetical protein
MRMYAYRFAAHLPHADTVLCRAAGHTLSPEPAEGSKGVVPPKGPVLLNYGLDECRFVKTEYPGRTMGSRDCRDRHYLDHGKEAGPKLKRRLLHIVLVVLATTMLGDSVLAQRGGHLLSGMVLNGDRDTALTNLEMKLFNSQGEQQMISWWLDGRFSAIIDRLQFYHLVVRADGFETRRQTILSCSYNCIDRPLVIELMNPPYAVCGDRLPDADIR